MDTCRARDGGWIVAGRLDEVVGGCRVWGRGLGCNNVYNTNTLTQRLHIIY